MNQPAKKDIMNFLFTKIKRTLNYHYFRLKNNWHFPSNTAHSAGARMAKGTHEPEVTEVIKKHLNEGSVFLDVGANVGYFTRMASDIVKERGSIFAFEVEYDNFHSLCRNTAPLQNVTPLNFAVCDKHESLKIFRSTHSSCHSILDTDNYISGEKFVAPTITLDLFWKLYMNKEIIDLIKIDVEGAELLVLKGMNKIINQDKVKTIILECCPQILINAKKEPGDIFGFLASKFSISIIEKEFQKLQKKSEITDNSEFERIINHLLSIEGPENMNLLCQRK